MKGEYWHFWHGRYHGWDIYWDQVRWSWASQDGGIYTAQLHIFSDIKLLIEDVVHLQPLNSGFKLTRGPDP